MRHHRVQATEDLTNTQRSSYVITTIIKPVATLPHQHRPSIPTPPNYQLTGFPFLYRDVIAFDMPHNTIQPIADLDYFDHNIRFSTSHARALQFSLLTYRVKCELAIIVNGILMCEALKGRCEISDNLDASNCIRDGERRSTRSRRSITAGRQRTFGS